MKMISTVYYTLKFDPEGSFVLETAEGIAVLDTIFNIQLNGIDIKNQKKLTDQSEIIKVEEYPVQNALAGLRIESRSLLWKRKTLYIECRKASISVYAEIEAGAESLCLDDIVYFASHGESDADLIYAPRFDWSRGIVHSEVTGKESLSCHQWLSPPPFFYGIRAGDRWFGAGVKAEPGQNNFLSFDYDGTEGPSFSLAYEGHTTVSDSFMSPSLTMYMKPQEDENCGLFEYTEDLAAGGYINRPAADIPSWWHEPIFCGWGQQRLDYRLDHDGHEMGNWINAGDVSTQIFYEKYLSVLEQKGIEPGIVIIDCFWAEKPGFAEPHNLRWPDMRGFIDAQHTKGRKVLLWFTPIIFEGLSSDCCMTVEGRAAAADPTSPAFIKHIEKEIGKMIGSGEGCLNADGFKIDFTQDIPAERGVFRNYLNNRWAIISEEDEKNYKPLDQRTEAVQLHGKQWGVEIIKEYLRCIRVPMKKIKADSLLITHTANPYFAEDVDMLRLNDMDGTSPDVLGIMGNRAVIASCCNPAWLIDTDNDLMINKAMWREYIKLQPQLGNPDTYYATGIAQSGEEFNDDDYELLREVWENYRKDLKKGYYRGVKIK